MDTEHMQPGGQPTRLAPFIRQHKQALVTDWERRVAAAGLGGDRLLDHVPEILDSIADAADEGGAGLAERMAQLPESRALGRLDEGAGVADVMREYTLLRACLLERFFEAAGATADPADVLTLDRAIDETVARAIGSYARLRERTLRAFNRIGLLAFGTRSLPDLLQELLRLFLETSDVADSTSILLRDDDHLVLRASLGLGETPPVRVRIGEGIVGMVAATRQPMHLRHAAIDPRVSWQALRDNGTRALYVVPLVGNLELVGVAHMGSRSAYEFSEADKFLFATMAARATSLITKARLAARESAARAERNRLLVQLQREGAERERFLAILSHDLRSPLQAILAASGLLLRRQRASVRIGAVAARIESSARRMARMIDELLDFTRARNGGMALRPGPADMHQLVRHVVDEAALANPDRTITLRVEGDGGGEWDADRVMQLTSNLIANALAYSPRDTPVDVQVSGVGDEVRLSVHNQGDPIPADVLPRLFAPFRRGAGETNAVGAGLGLGLFIAQAIANAHGSQIDVRSAAREGTTFTVRWPRHPSPSARPKRRH